MLYLVSTLKYLYLSPQTYSNFVSYESDGVSTVALSEMHEIEPFRDQLLGLQGGMTGPARAGW